MTKQVAIKLFEDKNVRVHWDNEAEQWYFAIIDVIAILTASADPRNYWYVLKSRLKAEGNKTLTNCKGLKMFLTLDTYHFWRTKCNNGVLTSTKSPHGNSIDVILKLNLNLRIIYYIIRRF